MVSLMFVAAHPDDDIFGAGPSVAVHADRADLRFVLVHATDGEAGEIAPDSNVTREELGQVRRQEATEAWSALGRLPDRHEWFGLPDGGLAGVPIGDLVERIAALLDAERPDVVMTFGPDGITGHSDHVTIGQATTEAFGRLAGSGPGLRRLLHVAIPQSWIDRWNARLSEKGLEVWDATKPFHLRGVPDETIGIELDTESVAHRVIAGLRAHRTQWSYQTIDTDLPLEDTFRRSHFVIAWPPDASGSQPLTDIFEGL